MDHVIGQPVRPAHHPPGTVTPGSSAEAAGLLATVYHRLLQTYGPQGWWPAESPFEIVVGAILVQHTAWRNAARAIAALKGAGVLTPPAIAALDPAALAALIRPAGFYRTKARKLQTFARYLLARYDGDLEALLAQPTETLRRELLSLYGIGPETADTLLLYAAGRPVFVVDRYTLRLFARLGLAVGARPAAVQALCQAVLPPDPALYNEYHALIVRHSVVRCRARPRCHGCPLADLCPSAGENTPGPVHGTGGETSARLAQ